MIFGFTALGRCLTGRLTGGWALLSCLVDLLLWYRWVHVGQLVDLSPPGPTSSHPSSFLPCITSDSSQPLLTPVDIQPLHHHLPGSTSRSSMGHPKNLSTGDLGLLHVGSVQEQDISGETCPMTAVTPQLFNSHVACGPWRGSSMLSSYPSRAAKCHLQLTPVLYLIEVLILNID